MYLFIYVYIHIYIYIYIYTSFGHEAVSRWPSQAIQCARR